jgi:hypothetical protein
VTVDDALMRLLWRAETMSRLAATIDAAVLDRLLAFAGDDTWLGPTATAFRDDLGRARCLIVEAQSIVRAAAQQAQTAAERVRSEQIRAGIRS